MATFGFVTSTITALRYALKLDGNNPVLDFVNTVEYRGTEDELDWLSSYGDA